MTAPPENASRARVFADAVQLWGAAARLSSPASPPPQQLDDPGDEGRLQERDAPEEDAERALDGLVAEERHGGVGAQAAAGAGQAEQHRLGHPRPGRPGPALVVAVVAERDD